MPNVHRKGRKQFAVRLTAEQREIFEQTMKAVGARDLSSLVIETIMQKAVENGIIQNNGEKK